MRLKHVMNEAQKFRPLGSVNNAIIHSNAYMTLPFILLLSCNSDPSPKGDGSFKDEKEIRNVFLSLNANEPQQKLPNNYYRRTLEDGASYIITGTDSHKGGGTVGVLFSDGTIFTHFCHVCGSGSTPLEAFTGNTKEEVIKSIKETKR